MYYQRRKAESIAYSRFAIHLGIKADHKLMIKQIDPTYTPPAVETKQVYGVSLQQNRNNAKINAELFANIVSKNKEVRCPVAYIASSD